MNVKVRENQENRDKDNENLEMKLESERVLLRLKDYCRHGQYKEQAHFEWISVVMSTFIDSLRHFVILGTYEQPKYKTQDASSYNCHA